jgi:hypothetical protein
MYDAARYNVIHGVNMSDKPETPLEEPSDSGETPLEAEAGTLGVADHLFQSAPDQPRGASPSRATPMDLHVTTHDENEVD